MAECDQQSKNAEASTRTKSTLLRGFPVDGASPVWFTPKDLVIDTWTLSPQTQLKLVEWGMREFTKPITLYHLWNLCWRKRFAFSETLEEMKAEWAPFLQDCASQGAVDEPVSFYFHIKTFVLCLRYCQERGFEALTTTRYEPEPKCFDFFPDDEFEEDDEVTIEEYRSLQSLRNYKVPFVRARDMEEAKADTFLMMNNVEFPDGSREDAYLLVHQDGVSDPRGFEKDVISWLSPFKKMEHEFIVPRFNASRFRENVDSISWDPIETLDKTETETELEIEKVLETHIF